MEQSLYTTSKSFGTRDGKLVVNFDDIKIGDVSLVGGKNASLGELIHALSPTGIKTPDGFALTSAAFWQYVDYHTLRDVLYPALNQIERPTYSNLSEVGQYVREIIGKHPLPLTITEAIKDGYRALCERSGREVEVAVRSSATAEDLPNASFAGQQESFLNVQGLDAIIEACHRCYASLFTDRAIKYREDNGFDHEKVALSVGIQQMVRSDLSSAGVAFTIDPETGHDNVIFISGSWGLGENVVQGTVNPDEFYLFKPSILNTKHSIVSRKLGSKAKTMVYGSKESHSRVDNIDTPINLRNTFILSDRELEKLGRWILHIEKHYQRAMDIEWAKDGITGELFIVQARPETVHSQRKLKSVTEFKLLTKGRELAKGEGLGNKIVSGKARILRDVSEGYKLQPGEIIVTGTTNPDWDPILKKAAGIVTDRGGRTSHAAIVAREIGTCAIVGCGDATNVIANGQEITIATAQGDLGVAYEGKLEWKTKEHDLAALPHPLTKIMMIVADPSQAYRLSQYPVDGVGLLRMEFAINNAVRIHPMALAHPEKITDRSTRKKIEELIAGYATGKEFFIERLSEAIGTIAAAFYPREVIVRMSDFKTNEYSNLVGGAQFEPKEENPMLGFRGASRYYDERYRDGFALECLAMKRVRDEMGLTNVKLMIPFCRTVEEGKLVLKEMEVNGLRRGENDLEIYVMAEIPSNILLAEDFAKYFDGFSIGSNDLTQLTLGIDRDSELVRHLFDENNEAVTTLISQLIERAHTSGVPVGLCGQAPSDHPKFAQLLVECGIDSISFNPDSVFNGILRTYEAELRSARAVDKSALKQEVEIE